MNKEEYLIFLDFDGVINDNRSIYPSNQIKILKNIIDNYGARVIVISSWIGNGNKQSKNYIIDFLNKYDIYNIDFINPNYEGSFIGIDISPRVIGIVDYLKRYDKVNYVILDDEYYNEYKLLGLNYYKTNKWNGLQTRDFYNIKFKKSNIKYINYVKYKIKKLGYDEQIYYNLIKTLKLYYNKFYERKNKYE